MLKMTSIMIFVLFILINCPIASSKTLQFDGKKAELFDIIKEKLLLPEISESTTTNPIPPFTSPSIPFTFPPLAEVENALIQLLDVALTQLRNRINQLDILPDCKSDMLLNLQILQDYLDGRNLSEWHLSYLENTLFPMIDATAKIPPVGILRGHLIVFGQYDECMLVKQQMNDSTRVLTGSYVRVFIDPGLRDYKTKDSCPYNEYGIGNVAFDVCIPSSCNQQNTLITLARSLIQYNGSSPVCEVRQASQRVRPIDYKTWIVVAVLIFFGITVVLATAYDLCATYFDFLKLTPAPFESTRWFRCTMAFSVIQNTKDLFSIANVNKAGQIGPIHFMRFISIGWVVLGHAVFGFMAASSNIKDGLETFKTLGMQIIVNAFFSVDTFFFMSGLLVSFIWFKGYHRNKAIMTSPIAWIMFYIHRIIRISPPYYITIAFYAFVFKSVLVNMPIMLLPYKDDCDTTWWTNFLYLNNYIDYGDQCYTVSWYLATDFQLHFFAPLLLVPLAIKPLMGYIVAGLLMLFSTVANLVTVYTQYFPPTDFFVGTMDPRMGPFARYTLLIYDAPWIRCQTYIVGILVGYLFQTKKTLYIPKILNISCWIISVVLGLVVVMALRDWIGYGTVMNLSARAFYSAFSKIAWSLILSYVTIACFYGYGGPINDFMSLPVWVPFGRLSYGAYLTHLAVIMYVECMGITSFTFSNVADALVIFVLPCWVLSFFFAYWLSVVFEISFGKVEMVFLGRARGKIPQRHHDKSADGKINHNMENINGNMENNIVMRKDAEGS